jgi:hypothetical protein
MTSRPTVGPSAENPSGTPQEWFQESKVKISNEPALNSPLVQRPFSGDFQGDSDRTNFIVIRVPIEFHTKANVSTRRRTVRAMTGSVLSGMLVKLQIEPDILPSSV